MFTVKLMTVAERGKEMATEFKKNLPLLFHFLGSFAKFSLSAAAFVLSREVQCFLS